MTPSTATTPSGRGAAHDFAGRDICRKCGRSRSAIDHLGWACTGVESERPEPAQSAVPTAGPGTHDFGSDEICRRCGRSKVASAHFGWPCLGRPASAIDEFPRTRTIRGRIADAIAEERRTGVLAAMLVDPVRQAMRHSGVKASEQDALQRTLIEAAIAGYIQDLEKVPDLLDAMWKAARAAQIGAQVRPILELAEAYFLDEADLIPDHLGLVGLRDDAYLVLTLLHRISERYRALTGRELIAADLSELLQRAAGWLNASAVQILDQKADEATRSLDATLRALVPTHATITMRHWSPRRGPGIDWKRTMVKDAIRSDLAKSGIFL